MHSRHTLFTFALLLVAALVPLACGSSAASMRGDAEADAGTAQPGTLRLADFQLKIPQPAESAAMRCSEPKPADNGCTQLCKPCLTFVCRDGEWVPHRIDLSDGICKPLPKTDPGPFACPRRDDGFCPASCSICF
jgi:hypothetical protein